MTESIERIDQREGQYMIGLKNICCSKDDWHYLLFYDIDETELSQSKKDFIDTLAKVFGISYLLFRTKHGFHFIGLTPLQCIRWANAFQEMKNCFEGYYSGHVIRVSRKKDEVQRLVKFNMYGEVIPNLLNVYASRFNLAKMPWTKETAKYLLVFEKYRTVNL